MKDHITLSWQGCTAEILLQGGQICSFRGPDGREAIWQADPAVWRDHSPILFPVCGSVHEDSFTIGGKPYTMCKHGFTRHAAFTVAKQGEDFVELVFTPNDAIPAMYPFDFVFHVTYTLVERGFTTTFLVENRSDTPMPFCVGGHTGYTCPMEAGTDFEDYQIVFPEQEDGVSTLVHEGGFIGGTTVMPMTQEHHAIALRHAIFDAMDTMIFTTLKSRSVRLEHKDSHKGLTVSFPKFEVLAIWSKPGMKADYLCIEPWHGLPAYEDESGAMEDKPFVTLLAPGRCYKTWFTAVFDA